MQHIFKPLVCSVAICISSSVAAQSPIIPTIDAANSTLPLPSYDDAPGTPDADDVAIWEDRESSLGNALFVGTLKDAGLVVFDTKAGIVQQIAPPNLPAITAADPPTPVGRNDTANPCTESLSGNTFGRFNNVAIAQGVQLGDNVQDLAIVTDRGCDRLRIYAFRKRDKNGVLSDVTSPSAPRLFPLRFVQPAPLQKGELDAGLQLNPLDDQNTAYGIGLWQRSPQDLQAFVSQRSRSVVLQVRFKLDENGLVTYEPVRPFVFDPRFKLRGKQRRFQWTPCRENADEDPQSEGIVVDEVRKLLYVAFETIGVYRIQLDRFLKPVVHIGRESLLDVITDFGRPYQAIPDDGEFECRYSPTAPAPKGAAVAEGSTEFAGQRLVADVEGLAISRTGETAGQLIVSSQGDDTFHLYDRDGTNAYLGAFRITNTMQSDGLEVTNIFLGTPRFPAGALVVQNGAAADPADISDINGFAYDGSTQFRLVSTKAILEAVLGPAP